MKKFSKITIFLLLSTFTIVGCSDLLDVDSNRLVSADQNDLKSANDTLYSMFGIFSQLEKLSNSYVLLGELRGDLMDVTDKSNLYLKQINNFDFSAENTYTNNVKDYYAVINNCNYVINNIDTAVVKAGKKVMLKEYAACKAIRAWTYMQLALNYGSAIYYEKPILTIEDAESVQNQTPKTFEEIAPLLIADLKPWETTNVPYMGYLFQHNTSDSYFPIRFLLGDLYLWTGEYEKAATEYHDLMFANNYVIHDNYYETNLDVLNNAFTGGIIIWGGGWFNLFTPRSLEYITTIASTNQYEHVFDLDSLTANYSLAPSTKAVNNWKSQMYYYNNTLDTLVDMRYLGSVSTISDGLSNSAATDNRYYIEKYLLMNPIVDKNETNKEIFIYRTALLYLRYAEAVNRLGKPNLALAVIKNGLNRVSLLNRKAIPLKEVPDPLPDYMNFTDTRFDGSIGIRMRGCGNVNMDTTNYIIPKKDILDSLNTDSINYVEDLIVNELALETAFEGNRFQDLMRVAIRRNDNAYLADKVAEKHTDNKEAIRTKLMTRDNWFVK